MTDKPPRTFADIARGIAELAEARKRSAPMPVPPPNAPPPPPPRHNPEDK